MELSLVGLAAVITALVGVFKFFDDKQARKNGEAIEKVSEQIKSLRTEMEKGQHEDKLAITRVELMMLISHSPQNVLEIERLAKKYFTPPLNGDSWMSQIYSNYAKEYGADHTFVTHS